MSETSPPWQQICKRRAEALRLRDGGRSLREIAAILGCSHQTVANDLGETGPPQRICKRCTGRGFHYLTCPTLELLCPKCGRPVRVCRGCP